MKKALLHSKLVAFQRRIIALSDELRRVNSQCRDNEDRFLLELLTVLDAFENVFANLAEKEPAFDKSAKRGMKSFRAIYRKLTRLLEEKDVIQMVFPEDRAAPMEWCQVAETNVADDKEDGVVLAIIKNGYQRGDRVIRPAEVITVANDPSGLKKNKKSPI